jgi:hypothetical protein
MCDHKTLFGVDTDDLHVFDNSYRYFCRILFE